jgi:ATP-dependent DNA helicase RecG
LPDKILDILFSKYLKALISFNNIRRVETYPVAREALREAIMNAVIHRDYTTGIPIQIKVLDDQIIIYNAGHLPEDWTIDTLMAPHTSHPHNSLIANAFNLTSYDETQGLGIQKMIDACDEHGAPRPTFDVFGNSFGIKFNFCDKYKELEIKWGLNNNVSPKPAEDSLSKAEKKQN